MSTTIPPVGLIPVQTKDWRLDSHVDSRHIDTSGEEAYLKRGATLIVSAPGEGTLVVIDYTTGLHLSDEVHVIESIDTELTTTTAAPLKSVRVSFRAPPTAGDDSGTSPRSSSAASPPQL